MFELKLNMTDEQPDDQGLLQPDPDQELLKEKELFKLNEFKLNEEDENVEKERLEEGEEEPDIRNVINPQDSACCLSAYQMRQWYFRRWLMTYSGTNNLSLFIWIISSSSPQMRTLTSSMFTRFSSVSSPTNSS